MNLKLVKKKKTIHIKNIFDTLKTNDFCLKDVI